MLNSQAFRLGKSILEVVLVMALVLLILLAFALPFLVALGMIILISKGILSLLTRHHMAIPVPTQMNMDRRKPGRR